MAWLYLHSLFRFVICSVPKGRQQSRLLQQQTCGSQSLLLALSSQAPFTSFGIRHQMHASKTPLSPSQCHTNAYSCVAYCPFTYFIRPVVSFIVRFLVDDWMLQGCLNMSPTTGWTKVCECFFIVVIYHAFSSFFSHFPLCWGKPNHY